MSYDAEEIRQQMTLLWAKALSQGHKPTEIIPVDMQDHFRNTQELQEARSYISEIEMLEKDLQEKIEVLNKELEAAKKEADNMPDDCRQLQLDCNLLKRENEIWKATCENEERRAIIFERKYKETATALNYATNAGKNVKELEKTIADLQITLVKQLEENRSLYNILEVVEERHDKDLEEKNDAITFLSNSITLKDAEKKQIEVESDALKAGYDELLAELEADNEDKNQLLCSKSRAMRSKELTDNSTVSEVKILCRFYQHSYRVLQIFQAIFKQLLRMEEPTIILPLSLRRNLSLAKDEYSAFNTIRETIQVEGHKFDIVREQLAGLAESAQYLQASFEDIATDLEYFVGALMLKPHMLARMKTKFRCRGNRL